MKEEWRKLFQLFWTFFKIGPATFGGGFAMIPLIEREIVEKKKWIESEDVTDLFALAQSVPGAVAINSASFIGHKVGGVKGAVAAMIGVSLPTFLIVLTLGISYLFIHDNPKIEAAFVSIRATILAIIVYAAIKTIKTSIVDKTTFFIMLIGVPALFFIHPVLAIILGAVTGAISIFLKRKLGYKITPRKDKDKVTSYTSHDYFIGDGI
ncbi:chromate transporter [Paenibacillus sp. BSR1-1]|uniref:chromate transporter n=1 Tax=Paenibacillus sp. BSR1-1 TaxID=3020845 RepID=UPI0025B02C5C|nr:chromate transporter [Paenibacillus sp. BSR1-1]MDN3017230.1 chromate transporter [Paenibacillus sp. BSR1-1]